MIPTFHFGVLWVIRKLNFGHLGDTLLLVCGVESAPACEVPGL